MCSVVSDSLQPYGLCLSSTWIHAAPSMGFPRQEHWSGLPCPSPGDLPQPGIEPASSALVGRFFTTLCHLGSHIKTKSLKKKCRRIRILPLSLQPLQLASLACPSARPVPVTPCVSLPGLHSRLGVGRVVKQQNVVFPPVLEVRCPRSSRQQVWFLLRLASLTCTWPRSPCVSG